MGITFTHGAFSTKLFKPSNSANALSASSNWSLRNSNRISGGCTFCAPLKLSSATSCLSFFPSSPNNSLYRRGVSLLTIRLYDVMSVAFSSTSRIVVKPCARTLPASNVTTKNIWYVPFFFKALVIACAAAFLNLISAKPGVSIKVIPLCFFSSSWYVMPPPMDTPFLNKTFSAKQLIRVLFPTPRFPINNL